MNKGCRHRRRKRKTPDPSQRILHVSHPFARAIVVGIKKYELRTYIPLSTIRDKRVMIGETVDPIPYRGVHPDLGHFYPCPGRVVGSVWVTGKYNLVGEEHLTSEIAQKCGFNLEGFECLFRENSKLYMWELKDPRQFRKTLPVQQFTGGRNGNVLSTTSVRKML